MNWYLVYSSGIHALAALIVILLLAPGATKPNATYTIDFIGSGKVQAVSVPNTAAPKTTTVKAPEPAQEAIEKAPSKTYVSKTEIAEKPTAKKQVTTQTTSTTSQPLAGPSVLEDEDTDSSSTEAFEGGNITTDFANFPYPWYITQVRNSLWVEWEKRRPAGNILSAMVSFAIARDGKIKNLRTERSSGDDSFDFAATSAVINAGPFAPLPMYYEKDELTITVEFKQEK